MRQYDITGMTCAACSARIEKAVSGLEGVTACSVSLLTNSMGVEGEVSPQAVMDAVAAAGYGASLKGGGQAPAAAPGEDPLADRETPLMKRRLIASLGFLAVLMYLSMGHTMWGWPVPAFFQENPLAIGVAQLLLTAAIMVIDQRFFISGFKGLLHRAPNMDTLVALGSGAAFVYSVYALFAMTSAQIEGGVEAAHHWLHEFYFESAAMILALITVGKLLEARSKGRTTDALRSLMKLAPQTATVVRGGEEEVIPIGQVRIGDVFVVRPGESIPVDGVVLEGESAVNEAALTGESIPVDKGAGDLVSAATINQSGFLRCEATRVGEDTTLSQIIRMVGDAAATKAPIAKIADKVSGVFVPVVMAIALVTAAVWLVLGEGVGYALARGISVLVISCPCALGLATPVAIMVGNGMGAKNGILFKTAVSLEEAGRVQIVALDKTGTITTGEPRVTDIIPGPGGAEDGLLTLAATLEGPSEHPLAKAIVEESRKRGLPITSVGRFLAVHGRGVRGELGEETFIGGNQAMMREAGIQLGELAVKADALAAEGKTPMFFANATTKRPLGVIAVADVIKEDSPEAIRQLQNMGIRVVMLTGDNERTARAIGAQAGVDEVVAGVLPGGKESVIRALQEHGKVAMVGDGINDAPALTRADIGIAIGAGADVAIDAADIVLMKSSLADVPAAIRLSRRTLRGIRQNLFWAFFYNVLGIPLAAGVLIPLGLTVTPMFAAAAMSLSSFCVVANALRLNLFDVYDGSRDRRVSPVNEFHLTKKESQTMKKTMKIEGMMCGHCEGHVKKALEAIEGVESAEVSHESGTAAVTLSAEVSDEALKAAVDAQGYQVTEIG